MDKYRIALNGFLHLLRFFSLLLLMNSINNVIFKITLYPGANPIVLDDIFIFAYFWT